MKKGFTLAEVLITLGIVGVVAVLTVPGVMKNYKSRLYTAQLQKAYAQIADSVQAMMNDQHVDNFYESTIANASSCSNANNGVCEKGVGVLLNNYFKVSKRNCATNDRVKRCIAGTGAGSYVTISSNSAPAIDTEYCIQNTNGAAICGKWDATNKMVHLLVDVNGTASPNMVGRDLFAIDIKSDGSLSDFGSNSPNPTVVANKEACDAALNGTPQLNAKAAGCLNAVSHAGWKMAY